MIHAVLAALLLPLPPNESFLPPNDLRIPIGSFADKGISRAQYDQVLDEIETLYRPIIAEHGGKLVVNRLWEDDTVNASAEQIGSKWIINMYGGLARHETITQDGFALVACHEIGHHLGGAPKLTWAPDQWISNEGQADYYGTLKCLRRVFESGAATAFTGPADDDETAKAACPNALCVREATAGVSLAALFSAIRKNPVPARLSTPDRSVVDKTSEKHPAAQCRLDTYFQGALCQVSYADPVDDKDPAVGACTLARGFNTGMRPLCWYKPE